MSIWSGKDFSDPYVVIQARGQIQDDLVTKKKYWDPMKEQYFQSPENPVYVILKFTPDRIEYYETATIEVWER